MAGFVKGEIVIVPFPFSDLSSSKRRPAIVLADLQGDDIILCQITSQFNGDPYAIPITQSNLKSGTLIANSNVRPNRIFTADSNIIIKSVGVVDDPTLEDIIQAVIGIISI